MGFLYGSLFLIRILLINNKFDKLDHTQDIMKKVLDQHRSGIIVKQVAAGREFQGCPFYSKPDVIHFKVFILLSNKHNLIP